MHFQYIYAKELKQKITHKQTINICIIFLILLYKKDDITKQISLIHNVMITNITFLMSNVMSQ